MKSLARRNPYFTIAKFPGTCAETGKAIKVGDRIAYYPASRAVYHNESKAADELRAQHFAQSWNMADANW